MFTVNEGGLDRGIRMFLGVALIWLGFGGAIGGTLGILVGIVGFLPLLTGLIGWCPAYALFGISTCPVKGR